MAKPKKLPDNFLVEPSPHDEASRWIATKGIVARDVFDQLLPELQARAFLITGLEALDELQTIRDLIAEVPLGEDWDNTKKAIADRLGPHLLQTDKNGQPDPEATRRASEARAQLLLRTHGFQAYAVAQHQVMDRQRETFPYWQYLSLDDARVRPTHRALDGLILPADSPFWADHSPPWEWGCRCRKVPLLPEEVAEIQAAEAALPREKRSVLDDTARRDLEQSGRLFREVRDDNGKLVRDPMLPWAVLSPKNRGDASPYTFDPAALTLPLNDLLDRYDPLTRTIFENFAKNNKTTDGRTIWAWLNGAKAVATAVSATSTTTATTAAVAAAYTPRSLAALNAQLDALEPDYLAATAAAEAAKKLSDVDAVVDALERQRDARVAALEALAIPANQRGTLPVSTAVPTAAAIAKVPNWTAGREIVERFVRPDLLPKIKVAYYAAREHCALDGTVHVNAKTRAQTIAHEIIHAVEFQHTAILERARTFLLGRRRKRERGRYLRPMFPGHGYKAHEMAFEDDWFARGGHIYSGKLYFKTLATKTGRQSWQRVLSVDPVAAFQEIYATEILTVGIERLHSDPLAFRREDREYFNFVLETLQGLTP